MASVADRITAAFLAVLLAATAVTVAGGGVGLPGVGDADAKTGDLTGLIEGESLTNARLHDCTVRDSTLELVHVENCTVEASTLKRSTVVESTLQGSTVIESGVTRSVVRGGEVESSSLIDSRTEGARVVTSTVRVTDHGGEWELVDTEVRKSKVENHTMRGGLLAQATALNTRLVNVDTDSATVKLADLAPVDARREGDRLVVRVANHGEAATYAFAVAARGPGGEELGRAHVAEVAAGDTVEVVIETGGPPPAGVEVAVDVDDAAPESNEGNNRGTY